MFPLKNLARKELRALNNDYLHPLILKVHTLNKHHQSKGMTFKIPSFERKYLYFHVTVTTIVVQYTFGKNISDE